MRVIHVVCTQAFAGVERYLTYTLPALAERGLEVELVGGPPAEMAEALSRFGIGLHPGAQLAEAVRSLSGLQADIVHAHMTTAEAAAVLTRPVVGGRLVATRHFARRRGSSRAARVAGALVARRLDAEVAISDFVATHIGVRSTTVHNGVPDALMGAHQDRVILVAQRFEAEKRTEVALRAFASSRLAARGWRLALAGRGVEEAALRHLSTELGVAGSVDFLGFRGDLPALMARAGILLAPTPVESFGLTVVEAMACGLPIVAAGAGAHRETVGRVTPENLFPPDDADAAAGHLVRLAGDQELRRAAGQALQRHQRTHLSIAAHADRLIEVYRAVLG